MKTAWFDHRGYVLIRQSHYGWWPHFLWSKGLKIFEEYTPVESNDDMLIPPLFYRGWVKRTTAAEQREAK